MIDALNLLPFLAHHDFNIADSHPSRPSGRPSTTQYAVAVDALYSSDGRFLVPSHPTSAQKTKGTPAHAH